MDAAGTVQEVQEKVDTFGQTLRDYFPDILSFGIRVVFSIVIFWIGGRLIGWTVKLVKRSLSRTGLNTGTVQFAASLMKIVLYILLIFNIAANFGVKESSLAALLGTAGVTLGLALQGGLSNLAGGMMLLLFKPFEVGDYIILNQQAGSEGTVTKIDICYTTLLSIDNKHIIIPNGTLSNTTIANLTARDRRRLEIKVGISYSADIKQARALLEKILQEDEDTRQDTERFTFVDELADSAVILGLRVWVLTDNYWTAKWRLNEKIKEEFEAAGVEIPYSQVDVHIK